MILKRHGSTVLAFLLSALLVFNCLGGTGAAIAQQPDSGCDGSEAALEMGASESDADAEDAEGAQGADASEPAAEPTGDAEEGEAADGGATREGADAAAADAYGQTEGRQSASALKAAPISVMSEQSGVITSIEALLQDGSGPVGSVSQWQIFRLKATFDLSEVQIHEGDTTTITLPDKLKFNQTAAFDIKNKAGDVIAHATIDGGAKTLTLTYTDFPETHSLVNGDFFFYVQIDRHEVDEEEDIPLHFNVSGQTVYGGDIHFIGIPDATPYAMSKSGYQNGDDGRTIRFQIPINTVKMVIKNAVLTDQVQNAGFTIVPGSLVIYKGTWVDSHGDWSLTPRTNVTDQYTVSYSDDLTSLTIDLGDIGAEDGFQIYYDTRANYDLVDGEVIRNNADLNGNDTLIRHVSATATYYEAGGSGEGYVFSIKVKKTDANGQALANAVFDVVRVSSGTTIGTITTGADGTGSITGLLKDAYRLVETTAPFGYKLLENPIEVGIGDFGSEKVAELTVVNEPETTSIPVSKTWVGPEAGPVTVRLTADGAEAGTLTLDEANGWKGTFENLPVYDTVDGHEISYNVSEDPVAGYASEREGSNQDGYTFTNTNTTTVDVSGSKTWEDADDQDGARPKSITVRLLADGVEAQSRDVTADDGWAWSFTNLPAYDQADGHEIVYSVTEDRVENYSTSYSGYNITNTHETGKTSVTVTKAWDDEDNKDNMRPASVTVRLYADEAATEKSIELNAENNWSGSFEDLDMNKNGAKIAYTVVEDDVDGYIAVVSGDAETGFVITNTHTPESTPPTSGNETEEPNDDGDDSDDDTTTGPKSGSTDDDDDLSSPLTGDGMLVGTLTLTALCAIGLAVLMLALRRKSRRGE